MSCNTKENKLSILLSMYGIVLWKYDRSIYLFPNHPLLNQVAIGMQAPNKTTLEATSLKLNVTCSPSTGA